MAQNIQGNASFLFTAGLDFSPVNGQLQALSNLLNKRSLSLPIDTSVVSPENAQKIMADIQKDAQKIQSVTQKGFLLRNKESGETMEYLTAQNIKYTNSAGKVLDITMKLNEEGGIDVSKFDIIGEIKGINSFGKEAEKIEKNFTRLNKSMEGYSTKAQKWLATSANMSGKDAENAKNTAQALESLARQWDVEKNKEQKDYEKMIQLSEQAEELNKQLDIQVAKTKGVAAAFRSWGNVITNAIKQTIAYTFSIGAMQKARDIFTKSLEYTIALDTEMTKIKILGVESASTTEEINKLAVSYNELAQKMGVTTLEVAKGSVEWLRQGKSISETQELLKSTLALSKLGALDSAQATEYLTAITNGFKISATDTIDVVDKLIAVDNIAATSAGELATALRYTSNSAQQAGVTFEQITSYIATVSSVTRGSAESIGQAFKTIFARMQDIQGGKLDEDKMGINKVEEALSTIDVKLRDSSNSFRNMSDVLTDVSNKWDTLSEVEQNNIAKAIAGTRQREMFLVLMNNMDMALQYQEEQYNASGLAMDRYGDYANSLQGKLDTLKAAQERFYSSSTDTEVYKFFIDLNTAVTNFGSAVGGAMPLLSGFIGLLLVFNAQEWGKELDKRITVIGENLKFAFENLQKFGQGFENALDKLSGPVDTFKNDMDDMVGGLEDGSESFENLEASIASNAESITAENSALGLSSAQMELDAGATEGDTVAKNANAVATSALTTALSFLGIALSVVSLGYMAFSWYQNKVTEDTKKAQDAFQKQHDTLKSLTNDTPDLIARYDELSKKVNLTTVEQKELLDIQNKLHELLPSLSGTYDRMGNFILSANTSAEKLNDTLREQIDLARQIEVISFTQKEGLGKSPFEEMISGYQTFEKDIKNSENQIRLFGNALDVQTERFDSYQEALSKIGKGTMRSIKMGGVTKYPIVDESGLPVFKTKEEIEKLARDGYLLITQTQSNIAQEQGKIDTARKGKKALEDTLASYAESWTDFQKTFFSETIKKAGLGDTGLFFSVTFDKEELEREKMRMTGAGTSLAQTVSFAFDQEMETLRQDKSLAEQLLGKEKLTQEDYAQIQELASALSAGTGETINVADLVQVENGELKLQEEQIYRLMALEAERAKQKADIYYNQILITRDLTAEEQLQWDITTDAYNDATTALQNFQRNQYAVINGITYSGKAIAMAAPELAKFFAWLVTNSGMVFTDVSGNLLQTEAQFMTAIENNLFNLDTAFGRAEVRGSKYYQNIIGYINQAQKYVTGTSPYAPTAITYDSASGGGGGGKTPEQEAAEKRIKSLEEEKKALQERLDEYKKYIDLKKQELKLQKEEKKFLDEMLKKNKSLAKLRTNIALLALDDSEEAQARRLQMEEEASTLEEEITQNTEDRKYDLQVQALDDMQAKFEESINNQIKKMDEQIAKLQEVAQATGGSGGNAPTLPDSYDTLQYTVDQVMDEINKKLEANKQKINAITNEALPAMIQKWIDLQLPLSQAIEMAWDYINAMAIARTIGGQEVKITNAEYSNPNGLGPDPNSPVYGGRQHNGGIIEAHHDGGFAKNLRSNEVFAKLLQGEYVATEGQMDNFLKNILPKIATSIPPTTKSGESVLNISMPINVEGNMDKTVIPDLENLVQKAIKEINNTMKNRGYIRPTTLTSI